MWKRWSNWGCRAKKQIKTEQTDDYYCLLFVGGVWGGVVVKALRY